MGVGKQLDKQTVATAFVRYRLSIFTKDKKVESWTNYRRIAAGTPIDLNMLEGIDQVEPPNIRELFEKF